MPGIDIEQLPQSELGYIDPMQAKLVSELPEGGDWRYEIKFDGYRAIVIRGKSTLRVLSRRNNVLNARFPVVSEALNELEDGLIVDGEIVALD